MGKCLKWVSLILVVAMCGGGLASCGSVMWGSISVGSVPEGVGSVLEGVEKSSVESEGGAGKDDEPQEIYEPEAQYIRTGILAHDRELKSGFRVIRSAQELEAYYEEFKGIYYLGRRETNYVDATIGFLDACDKFDDTFWENNDLVITTTLEGSGSVRHEVVNMVRGGEGSDADWVINIRTICPEICTSDEAFWHFLIEVPKGVIREEDKVRTEYAGGY